MKNEKNALKIFNIPAINMKNNPFEVADSGYGTT
jgi:hypothetical protein